MVYGLFSQDRSTPRLVGSVPERGRLAGIRDRWHVVLECTSFPAWRAAPVRKVMRYARHKQLLPYISAHFLLWKRLGTAPGRLVPRT
jgi:hypothetical protein